MRKFFVISLCLSLSMITSCRKSAGTKRGYFDSLVTRQITEMTDAKATLVKTATMGSSQDEMTLTPTREAWETELDVFRQLDAFQKPAYRSLYKIENEAKDKGSNLQVRSYASSAEIPVRKIKFYYFRDFSHLKRIEAEYAEQNSLYTGARRLSLEFDDVKGKISLSRYGMDGIQKMPFSDTINFSINGTVKY